MTFKDFSYTISNVGFSSTAEAKLHVRACVSWASEKSSTSAGELVKQNGNWYVSKNSTGAFGNSGSGNSGSGSSGTPATAQSPCRLTAGGGHGIVEFNMAEPEVFDWDEWENGKVYQLSNDELVGALLSGSERAAQTAEGPGGSSLELTTLAS